MKGIDSVLIMGYLLMNCCFSSIPISPRTNAHAEEAYSVSFGVVELF